MNPISIFDRTIIVDNFYTDPDSVRNYALSQTTEQSTNGNYAGIMTDNPFLTQEHIDMISGLVGHKVQPSTQFTGKFRFTTEIDTIPKQDIHFDPGDNNCCWAGVIYLTPNVTNIDGTIFWQHKRTKLSEIPRTLEGIKQYGWNDTSDLKTFLDTDGIDHLLWNKTDVVMNKYNRLVLFRPWKFHSPGPAFGTNKQSARLIQTFFLSPIEHIL
jgi:hypothetical protein